MGKDAVSSHDYSTICKLLEDEIARKMIALVDLVAESSLLGIVSCKDSKWSCERDQEKTTKLWFTMIL